MPEPIVILADLRPVEPGALAGLAEETHAAARTRLIAERIHFFAIDRRYEVRAADTDRHLHRTAVMHHDVERRLSPASGLAIHHVVVHHRDEWPQASLHHREFHGVIILLIARADGPAHALVFNLSEELQAIVGELRRRLENRHGARLHVAVRIPAPAGGIPS